MAADGSNIKSRICANCGNQFSLNPRYSAAQRARSRFCGKVCSGKAQTHARKPMLDLLGGRARFGKLTYVAEGPAKGSTRRAIFRCDCGIEKPMGIRHIIDGRTISCGCENAKRAASRFTKHGGYRDPAYRSYAAMMQRCHNEKSDSYAQYGARGIKVCAEWHGPQGYLRFLAYIGERPSGHSIDRIDNNRGYKPGNVRWATVKAQQNNRRVSCLLTHNGETLNARDWAAKLGMGKNTIYARLRAGWSTERALTEPAHMCGGRVA